ncbi:MAG: OprO/OprP family phosphate-selective porin [Bacteriovoracaceae bacterium]|nr:OprO/OprP family phosphate-selective porin [Bacteriovoracaceae bacterium]
MRYLRLTMIGLVWLSSALAETKTKFPLGNGEKQWGVSLNPPESAFDVRLGARFQALASLTRDEGTSGDRQSSQDFYGRRVQLHLQADHSSGTTFYMDLRNDNVNKEDNGEGNFKVGAAYAVIPLRGFPEHYLQLYRAKVDVSRTETISSAKLLFINRPYVADEAAQFVSHNRRAMNVQLNGRTENKFFYHLVVGDGVHGNEFNDASGNGVDRIERQNFMVGGRVRYNPISGWEYLELTENYFGEGKHFTVGGGVFNTSNIRFQQGPVEESVSRTLISTEFSFHYREFSFSSEYFHMNGVIEDHNAPILNQGKSEGYYFQSEWVFTRFHYLAPFARYEKWDRFIGTKDFETQGTLWGLNWYLNGNRFRVSLAYEEVLSGNAVANSSKVQVLHLASLWRF